MSVPRYSAYKGSGVKWLGDVPTHWDVRKVRWLFEIRKRIAGELGFDVLSITQQGFKVKDVESNEGQVSLDYSKYQLVEVGDFAMNHMDLITGGVDIAKGRGVTSPDYRVFSIRERLNFHDRFFLYLFQNCLRRRIFFAYGQGSSQLGRWRFPADNFKDFRFPVPPSVEQGAIARFLDRETSKIDELVGDQRRLIDLLKEKRRAVISHAVTKGLNPSVRMKPSSVEWLGNVPEHWKIGKCGFYISILSGFAFPSVGFTTDESDTKLLRGINVAVSRLRWDETVYWRRSEADGLDIYELQVGDIVIGMDRPLIGEGIRVAKIKEHDVPCLLLQRVASLKTNSLLNPDYLLGLLSSEMFVAHFLPDATGVSVPHISPEQIKNFVIPVPPIVEQETIAAFVTTETGKVDTLIAEAERAIALLEERRNALISAAVTGKIDVRGLVDTEAA